MNKMTNKAVAIIILLMILCSALAFFGVWTIVKFIAADDSTEYNITVHQGEVEMYGDIIGEDVEVLNYGSRAYIDVETIADYLDCGYSVNWITNKINIGSSSDKAETSENFSNYSDNSGVNSSTSSTYSASDEYSRLNPAGFDTPQIYVYEDAYYDEYLALEISISDFMRGEEAYDFIKAEDSYNEAPPEGMEYICVKADVKVLESSPDEAFYASYYDFYAYSSSYSEYSGPWIYSKNDLDGRAYAGGTISGYLFLCVDVDDETPSLVFDYGYDSTAVWFKLYE